MTSARSPGARDPVGDAVGVGTGAKGGGEPLGVRDGETERVRDAERGVREADELVAPGDELGDFVPRSRVRALGAEAEGVGLREDPGLGVSEDVAEADGVAERERLVDGVFDMERDAVGDRDVEAVLVAVSEQQEKRRRSEKINPFDAELHS